MKNDIFDIKERINYNYIDKDFAKYMIEKRKNKNSTKYNKEYVSLKRTHILGR